MSGPSHPSFTVLKGDIATAHDPRVEHAAASQAEAETGTGPVQGEALTSETTATPTTLKTGVSSNKDMEEEKQEEQQESKRVQREPNQAAVYARAPVPRVGKSPTPIEPQRLAPSDYKGEERSKPAGAPAPAPAKAPSPGVSAPLPQLISDPEKSTPSKRFEQRGNTAAALLVKCLEAEGVRLCFGIPGEETAAFNMALQSSTIRTVLTRHEQGASFMADVCGRLTGRAGVCFATLGPGSTNILTGVANANMEHSPLVVITGQAEMDRWHKESHQYIDTIKMFEPITKWSVAIRTAETIPEIVRKAFRVAHMEKPGAVHIQLPLDLSMEVVPDSLLPLHYLPYHPPSASQATILACVEAIKKAKRPLIFAGHGVVRSDASAHLATLCSTLSIPCIHTSMAAGILPHDHLQNLFTVASPGGGPARVLFQQCDLLLCIGYDVVECPPKIWNDRKDMNLIHIDSMPAEVDLKYTPFLELIGDVSLTLQQLNQLFTDKTEHKSYRCDESWYWDLRDDIVADQHSHDHDETQGIIHPIKILSDLQEFISSKDILVSDVGCHMLWIARYFQRDEPNTLLLAGSFSSMGFGLPGAIGAALTVPHNVRVVSICGDGGFLMQIQEMETAKRLGTNLVVLVWADSEYGMITMEQESLYGQGHHSELSFTNPNFTTIAQAFGWKGYHVQHAKELKQVLTQAFSDSGPVLVSINVDYSENHRLVK